MRHIALSLLLALCLTVGVVALHPHVASANGVTASTQDCGSPGPGVSCVIGATVHQNGDSSCAVSIEWQWNDTSNNFTYSNAYYGDLAASYYEFKYLTSDGRSWRPSYVICGSESNYGPYITIDGVYLQF